jgi:hypothetical protein
MQTCPICGKKAEVWHPGNYKLCSCPCDCGNFEILVAAEAAMKLNNYDGIIIGIALRRRRKPGQLVQRIDVREPLRRAAGRSCHRANRANRHR